MKWIKYLINLVKSIFSDNEECDTCFEKKCETLTNENRYAVIVGMEKSKWGNCPGADRDSNTMLSMISQYVDSSHIIKLNNAQATGTNVVNALKNQIAKVPEDGLMIFTYSGHGGQNNKSSNAKDEVDGKDEFLCLYDSGLIDNDIWVMFNQCKGRILFICDSCHSSTMYRLPNELPEGIEEEDRMPLDKPFFTRFENARSGVNMLAIAGCGEETISWGDSANGGVLTSSLKRAFNKCLSYKDWWSKAKADKSFKQVKQVPYFTVIGGFDTDAKVFN